ncbi:hypothetical protein OH733_05220 [Streptomyces griseus]|uniref:hypothetical protein n=1 Tax=Streptomyces griseus TaxID=1911 RepID=UPI00386A0537|nr:hypothetical protein OH733_05220 [Streptomyces griseus]WTD71199.1 hypothetical protein OH763_31765 [Streptomyces griseus]
MKDRNELPQWTPLGEYGSGPYELEDSTGVTWRLWQVDEPEDLMAPGYRLAPRDDQSKPMFIRADHGLHYVLDVAGNFIVERGEASG